MTVFPWHRGRRRALLAASLAAALPLSLTGALPAGAGGRASAAPKPGPPGEAVRVSLITGDSFVFDKSRGSVLLEKGRKGIRYRLTQNGDDWYAVPSDAQPLIGAKAVDRELFNLTRLVRDGLADERKPLPVIVGYGEKKSRLSASTLKSRAQVLPGSGSKRVLDPIDAVALKVDRKKKGALWAALAPGKSTAKPRLKSDARRLMLDVRVRATLDKSVPQIGAPQAWQAGYTGTGVKVAVLDTGINSHPDLSGVLLTGKSFVPSEPSVLDENGHGTHVAATIAGRGVGSTPARKGVAPGTKLVVGKVLGGDGYGQLSEIVDGMTWAADAQDADVVSMSLGVTPQDGTELLDQAVDSLSQSTGALFVVAAGNDGGKARTINSPGTAASALTVGAVDGDDQLASFSSRGPLLPDGAVKPDITAPGVNIVAARAPGTSQGTPVDDRYTSMSGTSMATPHVAGVAALLKQKHPSWNGAQLKAAIVGSAKDVGRTSYEAGAGRVQADKAIDQTVTASPATLSFDRQEDAAQQATKAITYTNTGSAPVTLALAAAVNGPSGQPLPSGSVQLSATSLTIAAGQTGQVNLTLSTAAGAKGLYTGHVTATAGNQTVRTAVGLEKSNPIRTVAFHVVGRDGAPLTGDRTLTVASNDDASQSLTEYTIRGGGTLNLPEGSYTFALEGDTTDDPERLGFNPEQIMAVMPQYQVQGDADVTFDVRQMKPVAVGTPAASLQVAATPAWRRAAPGLPLRGGAQLISDPTTMYVLPTAQPVTLGTFSFGLRSQRIAYQVGVTAGQTSVQGRYVEPDREGAYNGDAPLKMFANGNQNVPMVYGGSGSAADLAGVQVSGRLVLVRRPTNDYDAAVDLAQRLADAGALGVVVAESRDGYQTSQTGLYGGEKLPVVGVTREQGLALQQAIGSQPAQVALSSTRRSPWVYNPAKFWKQEIPANPAITMTAGSMAVVNTTYPAHEDEYYLVANAVWPKDEPHGIYISSMAFWGPVQRLEAYPVDADLRWQRTVIPTKAMASFGAVTWSRWDVFAATGSRTEVRGRLPLRLGQLARTEQPGTTPLLGGRRGDTFYPIPHLISGDGHHEYGHHAWGLEPHGAGVFLPDGDKVVSTLTRDGTPVQPRADGTMTVYDLPQGRSRYEWRLVHTPEIAILPGYKTDTTWAFDSERPGSGTAPAGYVCGRTGGSGSGDCAATPLLLLDYGIPLGQDYRAAPGPLAITVGGYHQPGADDPGLDGVQASVSYDNGTTWQPITTERKDDRTFTAALTVPQADAAHQNVSLRFQARDADGNTVSQTFHQMFKIRS